MRVGFLRLRLAECRDGGNVVAQDMIYTQTLSSLLPRSINTARRGLLVSQGGDRKIQLPPVRVFFPAKAERLVTVSSGTVRA